jgi:Carboxypeptidase regulatory-like domain
MINIAASGYRSSEIASPPVVRDKRRGMQANFFQRLSTVLLATGTVVLGSAAWAQTGTSGSISVTVVDTSGGFVPGAELQLRDLSTNVVVKAETQGNGAYTFPSLTFGTYELTVSKTGFESQTFQSVQVQTSRVTDIRATLKVGSTTSNVTVISAETALVETDSSVIADTVDTRQVVNLPVGGRNVFLFSLLVPGWTATGAPGSTAQTTGTFDNMPGGAIQSANYDGTPANASRFRSSGYGYGYSAVQPRIENIAEMTVSTAQLDLSGSGTSSMGINMVTRRGTNGFHGRLFEDFRNTALNANSWYNNDHGLPTAIIKLNDFGGSFGGPIWRNKLFFFGTYAESIQPGANTATASVLSPAAQQGIFTYKDSTGATQSINLMTLAAGAGAPSTLNPLVASQFQKINGSLNAGALTPTSDPNIQSLNWAVPNRATTYYPALRFDYYATQNIRLNVSYSQTKSFTEHGYTPIFPGGIDPTDYTSSGSNNKIAGFGVDWTLRPTLINSFHFGYLYQYSDFSPENLGLDLTSITVQNWSYGTSLYGNGVYPRTAISSLYSPLSFTDSLNWQRGNHSLTFGGGWFREHDLYWNGPGGFPYENMGGTSGFASNDPLGATFTSALKSLNNTQLINAENLYSELTGRVASAGLNSPGRPLDPSTKQYKPYGQYNLDELMTTGNFFAQDRWRLRPNLTLNFGLRWDIVGDDNDVNGGYSSVASLADFWGPTPVGAIFQPGVLGGVANPVFTAKQHVYHASYLNPQPAVALAWSPQAEGFLGKIFPKNKTVIRTGWSLRNYQEGQQNFWAWGSNSGLFFYQQGTLSPDTSGAIGTYQPGSLFLGQPLPAYNLTPATWSSSVPASALSFGGNSFYGLNPNIREPYVESWNFGVQRQLTEGTALEVRYVGNMAMHEWMSYNINERNIFENGFLTEFSNAQKNLAVNQANGKGNTFANNGLAGQVPLPIFTTAFGSPTSSNFTNGTFITNLQTGAAGTLAGSLASNVSYFCNMVGSNFSPCASRGYNTPGTYPVNFWEVNPYTTGSSLNYLDAAGHSNYHAMQVELRQRLNHGMEFNVNYSLGKSLVLAPVNAYQANAAAQAGSLAGLYLTDRNFRLNYGPSGFDIRQVLHASGTYDLPFGRGKKWLSRGKLADEIVGGWTLGTILVMQSGSPTQLSGGYSTVNANDAGVVLSGPLSQLQSNVGVYKSGNPWVSTVNPTLLQGNGEVNQTFMSPAQTAGIWGYRGFAWGPRWWNDDLSLNKAIPIRESMHFTFQAQFLNLFNHPTFSFPTTGLNAQSLTFGQSTAGPTLPRRIELRANLEF